MSETVFEQIKSGLEDSIHYTHGNLEFLKLVGRLRNIPFNHLKAHELAQLYAYYVIEYGAEHIKAKDVLSQLFKVSRKTEDEIESENKSFYESGKDDGFEDGFREGYNEGYNDKENNYENRYD